MEFEILLERFSSWGICFVCNNLRYQDVFSLFCFSFYFKSLGVCCMTLYFYLPIFSIIIFCMREVSFRYSMFIIRLVACMLLYMLKFILFVLRCSLKLYIGICFYFLNLCWQNNYFFWIYMINLYFVCHWLKNIVYWMMKDEICVSMWFLFLK